MGVNKIILVGNLGKDPELRYSGQQTAICNFSLATGERRKDSDGNWVDHTEWHRIVVFGKTAENCSMYLKKGKQVYIEGRIQTRKWQDKDGRDRYTTEVVAQSVQFLGSRNEAGDTAASSSVVSQTTNDASTAGNAAGNGVLESLATADAVAKSSSSESSKDDVAFEDDDIPF